MSRSPFSNPEISMSFNLLFEGERRFAGVLGVNAGIGGIKAAALKAHNFMSTETHVFTNTLTVVQILVAVATLVYVILKIRKVLKKKNKTE